MIVALLAAADPLFVPVAATPPAGVDVSEFVAFTKIICSFVLAASAIATMVEIVREVYRMLRRSALALV